MQRLISSLAFGLLALAQLSPAATPQLVSLSPSSGSGQTQTFTVTVSDTAGASDVAWVDILINSAFNGENGCWMSYNHVSKQLSLANDAGTWGSGGNSQCSVSLASASDSGNNATVAVNVTFNAHWTGDRTVWVDASDTTGDDSGYQQAGTYTVVAVGPVPDFSVSITPMSQTTEPGQSVSYNVAVTSINGFTADVNYTVTASQPSGLTIIQQGPQGNGFDQSFVDVPPDGTGTGTIIVRTASSTPPNNITLTANFSSGLIQHSYQVTLLIAPPSAPTVSLSPTSGSGSTQTFVITATDQGGFGAVGGINFLMNSSLNGTNGCWLFYQPLAVNNPLEGTLALASDDTTNWSNSTQVSSNSTTVQPISNSQCSVFGGTTTVSGSGNTLTLTITLTFTASFAGPKLVYVGAHDADGPDSGYQQLGAWTAVGASGSPDFEVGIAPGSQSVTGQTKAQYSVTVTGANGYSGTVNLSVTGLPPNSTLIPPAGIGPGQTTMFTVNTTGATPTGAYTLTVTGTDGTLTHSTNFVLNVTAAAMPILSTSPNSGTGTTQTFTFLAQGQGGTTEPSYLNVLINSSVNGQGACWMYISDTGGLQLASDDGSAWENYNNTTQSVQNSQCTLTAAQNTGPTDSVGVTVTITFSGTFTGNKDIFMHATDPQGGDTGYQLQGTWTVP